MLSAYPDHPEADSVKVPPESLANRQGVLSSITITAGLCLHRHPHLEHHEAAAFLLARLVPVQLDHLNDIMIIFPASSRHLPDFTSVTVPN